MSDTLLLWLVLASSSITAVLAAVALVRASGTFRNSGRDMREELRLAREESRTAAKDFREEVSAGLRSTSDGLTKTLEGMSSVQKSQVDSMATQLREMAESSQRAIDRIRDTFDARVKELQDGNEKKLGEMRLESSAGLKTASESLSKSIDGITKMQQTQLEAMTKQLKEMGESNQVALDRIRMQTPVQ